MTDDEKLKIALEALLELSKYDPEYSQGVGAHNPEWVCDTAKEALREVQRDHYLGTTSPVVAEVLAGMHL